MSDPGYRLTLFAFLRAKASRGDELCNRLMAISEPARAEPGNINYDLHRSNDDPDIWILYENWKSSADLDAHFEKAYMKAFVANLGDVLEGDMDLRRATMVTKAAKSKA